MIIKKTGMFLLTAGLLSMISSQALGFASCWTPYFNPGKYSVSYDDSGVRYIAGLPEGITCSCTASPSVIWVWGDNKRGTTSAVLAASMSGKQVRFLIQQENSDNYCRSSIMEIQPD